MDVKDLKMDFIDRLFDVLELNDIDLNFGVQDNNSNSGALRIAPSSPSITYLDDSYILPFNFQVLVNHEYSDDGYKIMQHIENVLVNLDRTNSVLVSKNNSFMFVNLSIQTSANYVQKTEHGHLWTALYSSELLIKQNEVK